MRSGRIWAKLVWLVLFASFFWAFSFGARADEGAQNRVFDGAGLFTEADRRELEDWISRQKEEVEMDLAVVTAYRQGQADAEEYADLFYHEYDLGKDCFLSLIYMDRPGSAHGEYSLSTQGDGERLLTDSRLEEMGQLAVSFLADQDYAGSALAVLEAVKAYRQEGYVSGQYNYNTDTGAISPRRSLRWYEIAAALAAAAVVAAAACMAVIRDYSMKGSDRRKSSALRAYQAQCRILSQGPPDRLVNQFVTRHRIVRPSSGTGGRSSGRSSTYRSRGGGRHGGRGGRF